LEGWVKFSLKESLERGGVEFDDKILTGVFGFIEGCTEEVLTFSLKVGCWKAISKGGGKLLEGMEF